MAILYIASHEAHALHETRFENFSFFPLENSTKIGILCTA